ncbi:MAG: GAF domain-containing protein, partial [Chloroflexi bacterium]|nr:GAF domain-containing protein [Chloroflexota bacterium]
MNRPDEPDRRIGELEARLSRLSEASLRINESLDFDTVLQQVLDSARDLTGAGYGVIATRGEHGGPEAIVTSGTSEDEHRQVVDLPGGTRIFAHFISMAEPLRVDNWGEYAASSDLNGFLPMTVWAGMYAPIRQRGQGVGVIFLGHAEEERRFTTEDEEVLLLFASQAAMAVANARRHREERRARADLKTLIDTSPVGVAVFDAVTGSPKSFNREARRIVDSLRNPDQTPED